MEQLMTMSAGDIFLLTISSWQGVAAWWVALSTPIGIGLGYTIRAMK